MVGRDRAGDAADTGDLPEWRAGMRTRGGRVTHTIARAGWMIFGGVGAALGVVLGVMFGVAEDDPDSGFVGMFIGGMIIFVPICAVVFVLVGFGAQFGLRAWLRTAPPVVSEEERKDDEMAAQVDEAGLRAESRWAEHYEHCLRSVAGFHDIVAALPADAAGEWFDDIGQKLDNQLAEALRLAKLGDSLEESNNSEQQLSPTAVRIDESLQTAMDAFAQTTERAASIALELHGDADFTRVRSQLDMLHQQAPQLHEL